MEATAHPPPPTGAAAFQKILDTWATALLDRDADAIRYITDQRWHMVHPVDIFDRRDFLQTIDTEELSYDEITFQVVSVKHVDDVAIVVSRSKSSGTWRESAFTTDEWVTDIFVWREQRWQCQVTSMTPRQSPTASV